MTPEKKGASRKTAARMRRIREIRKKNNKERARSQITKEQAAMLLKTWSRQGIVRGPAKPM